jgi:UDP-3-O-[3-hydroxymyristoyl] glucosamine N-acyltransferase
VHWFLDARKTPSVFQGIHPTAVIGPNVEIAVDVSIAPYVVIDQHCSIGEGTHIGPFVSVGPGCRIGKQCHLHAHAVLREGTILGDRVIVQPGAVLGSCGYGYMTDAQGHHTKLPQLGIVSIGDDVEIGANTTIDRARFRKTIVGRGTKVDNLVQVAHNVEIGEHNLIVSQVGMAGSSKTGDHCILGGQGAVVGHVELDPHVILTARAAASKNLTKGVYSGAPALPHHEHMRQSVEIRRLGKLVAQINSLETKIKDLIQTNNSVTMS